MARHRKIGISQELERLYTSYHWVRLRVLRRNGIAELPFFILYRAVYDGEISLKQVRQSTGRTKQDLNKALQNLVPSMVTKRVVKDRRARVLRPTSLGTRTLTKMQDEMEEGFRKIFGKGVDFRYALKILQELNAVLRQAPTPGPRFPYRYVEPAPDVRSRPLDEMPF